MKDSDVRILKLAVEFVDVPARTPLKFGGVVVRSASIMAVRAFVETRAGKRAEGHAAMALSNAWGWPSKVVPASMCLEAMRVLGLRLGELLGRCEGYAHPIDRFVETIEPECLRLADEVCRDMRLAEPMPKLCALICAAPFDGALHDAFGLANGIDSFRGLGPEHMDHDLSRYLGSAFAEKYPGRYVRDSYLPKVPIFHLVGGLDKLSRSEVTPDDPQDGLPNCLADWIARDGVYCLKVKLRGNDLKWDIERTLTVEKIGREELEKLGITEMFVTSDSNEMCPDVEYVIEYLRKVKEGSPRMFDAILYVEQPTSRDLKAHPTDMSKASRLKPILADEALTDNESLDEALRQGYSGAAMKTCKGQSACLLMLPKLSEAKIPYAVQDLSLPGLALLQSAGLAARIRTIKGVESNGRQFFPAGSKREAVVHPGFFRIEKGEIDAASLRGPGLGFRWNEMPAALLP